MRMRPHLRSRMPGSTRPGEPEHGNHHGLELRHPLVGLAPSAACAPAGRRCWRRGCRRRRALHRRLWIASTSSLRSPTKVEARPGPFLPIASAASFSRSPLRAVIRTCAPSAASASAMPRPRPRLEDRTMARLPARPRSMDRLLCVISATLSTRGARLAISALRPAGSGRRAPARRPGSSAARR